MWLIAKFHCQCLNCFAILCVTSSLDSYTLVIWFLHPIDTQENPELIWNDDSREKVSEIVETMTNK